MFILPPDSNPQYFPPVELASPEGLLAMGGDLCSERLLEAYRHGIFPWYNTGQPILWWSPDPRATLLPENLKVSRSLRKSLRQQHFTVTLDTVFPEVITACAAPRQYLPRHQQGTWIVPEMQAAYCRLHEQGYAHSVEAWQNGKLVGGLYGVALGQAFFGESMFSGVSNASKIALVWLVRQLQQWGFSLIDCQVSSPHLASLGAIDLRRETFMNLLEQAVAAHSRPGAWQFDPGFRPVEADRP